MYIEVLDSTLRDGMQSEGIAFSSEDKLKIAATLGMLGIPLIEAGNPASNPKDADFFRADRGALSGAELCAFGSTCRKDVSAEDDAGVRSLLAANTSVVSIFGKCSVFHVERVLATTKRENLRMIADTVSCFKKHGRRVIFDAEHWFDGYRLDAAYAMECLEAALGAGADVLCLCDTNGGSYYTDVYDGVKAVVRAFDAITGIHCHNDSGLAVANTLAAVDAGARHIQGTMLGFGERCGNANLSTLLPTLQLKRGFECLPPDKLRLLTPAAHRIAELSNVILSNAKPYVGHGAFAHKGGMHIDAVRKEPSSFEHIAPELVGNDRHFLISEMSGKSGIMSKINSVAPDLTRDDPRVAGILARLKELEYMGYQFEAAEQSLELLILSMLGRSKPHFELEYFRTIGEQPRVSENSAYAIIKVRVNGVTEVTAAEGNGPVNAIDKALKRALTRFYPALTSVRLTDYKVRVLESGATTAATVRVLIESTDGERKWSTAGVSEDIINASFKALVDSIEYSLLNEDVRS